MTKVDSNNQACELAKHPMLELQVILDKGCGHIGPYLEAFRDILEHQGFTSYENISVSGTLSCGSKIVRSIEFAPSQTL